MNSNYDQIINQLQMSFSQSRISSRGPLIAVIKIELQENKVDRIFLHQNDDDYTLAVEFVNKHNINKSIINHIFQRIKMSREAVQNQSSARSHNNPNRQTEQFHQFQSSQTKGLNFESNQRRQLSQLSPAIRKDSNFQKTDYSLSYRNPVPLVHQKKQQQKQSKHQGSKIPKENKVYYQHTNNINNNTKQNRLQNSHQSKLNEQNEFIMYSDSSKKNTQSNQQKNQIIGSSNKKNDQFLTQQYRQFVYNNEDGQKNKFENKQIHQKNNYPAFKKNAQSSSHQEKEYQQSSASEGLFQQNAHLKQSRNSKQKNQYQKFVNINRIQRKENKDIFGSIGHLKKKQRNSPQNKVTQFYERSQHQDSPLFNQSENKAEQVMNMPKKQQTYQKSVQDFPYSYISFSGKKPQANPNINMKLKVSENELKRKENLNAKQNIESTQKIMNSLSRNEISSESNSKRFQHQSQKQKDNTLQSGQIFHNRSNINFSARQKQKQKQDINKTVKYSNNYNNSTTQQKQSSYKYQPQQVLSLFQKTQKTIKINPIQTDQDKFSRPSRVKILNKQEIMSLKQSHLNRSLSKSQIKKINNEVTSRLYNQTEIKKKYLHAIKSRAKQLQDQEDLESQELTHRPQINAVSKFLAQGRREKPLEEYLMQQGKLLQIKRQQSVSKFARKQLQQCSFRPQINLISQKLMNSRSKSSIKQSKCQKTVQNVNKFKPQINPWSYQLIKNKGNFFQRQKNYIEQKNSKLFQMIQQKRFDEKRDKISGQNLFKPQIKDSKVVKIERNKDVYQYLYGLSKKVNQTPKSPHKPIINSKSQRLVEQMQQKRLTWIFSQLDSDNDGVISARKICVDFIPEQILLIIAPVLYEMQEINQSLNLQQFKNAVNILQKTLDPNRKNILFNYRKGGQCEVQLNVY